MQKTLVIICRQCVKTNTFSLSFHILFSPFLPKTHRNQDLGMGKNGVGPPQYSKKYFTGTFVMADRKVLNKYYPPDFDPSKLPRLRLNPVKTFVVRIMAPFNMRCNTCGEYIYKGKKFNSKKEDVLDMDYLGLKIFRFFIKCTRCLAEISFRTDPENCDYVCEQGATRNFQAHEIAEKQEKQQAKQEEEDEANPMKVLEKRTKESKNEMDIIDALEELKDLNARHANASIDKMLETVVSKKTPEELADEEDARIAREIFEKKRIELKKLEESKIVESEDSLCNFLPSQPKDTDIAPKQRQQSKQKNNFSGLVVKKKRKLNQTSTISNSMEASKITSLNTSTSASAAQSSLQLVSGYSSSESD